MSKRRDTAKIARKAEAKLEKTEVPSMKATEEIVTQVVRSTNPAVKINFGPAGPMLWRLTHGKHQ